MSGTVVVTDGDERAALALTRALGADGWRVIVTAPGGRSLAGSSRFAARNVAVPDPLLAPADFVESIARICADECADLLLPVSEGSLLAVTDAPSRLGDVRVPWPSGPIIRRVLDKAAVLACAESVGIAVPAQAECVTASEAIDAVRRFGGRAALKPARSVGSAGGTRAKVGVVLTETPADAERAIADLPPQAWPLLVQRRLVGEGLGVFVLRWNNRVLATFAHRRLREKPPSGGVSVLSESAPRDAELEARAIALLEALEWNGVAMVEFKRDDEAGGRPTLMEINGRFWGSVQLAIDAGVNFPVLLASAAMGAPAEPVRSWDVGRRLRWVLGDVDHLLIASKATLAREGPWSLPRAWLAWRGAVGSARAEVGGRGDDGPFRYELRRWIRGR